MKKQKIVQVSYWLTPAQAEFIRKVAFKRRISQSELIREVVKLIKK